MSGCTGTVQEILALMSVGGIDKAAMMNMTPVADMREAALAAGKGPLEEVARQMIERMKRRNDWTCQTAREQPSLVPFIGLDPSMGPEDAVAEVHRCREQGASASSCTRRASASTRTTRTCGPSTREAESLEMPVLSHGGVFPADLESSEFSRPRAFARMLEAFPRAALRAGAHGPRLHRRGAGDGGAVPEHARRQLVASSPARCRRRCPDDEAVALLRRFGAERILFASDWPWFHPLRDLERIETLALSDSERRLILSENARRVMGI